MSKRRRSFTLVELLVAMGVLTLLVMLMLQLFGGAQKLWVANEKRSGIYADARAAMELMAELIGTVQFSCGEKLDENNVYQTDASQNTIFSLDTATKSGGKNSSAITFLAKTSRDLPMKDNYCRFISFRLGSSNEAALRGKLLMLIYADKTSEDISAAHKADDFYKLFPPYDTNRDTVRNTLNGYFNTLIANFKGYDGDGEYEHCQVIAENVVSFKLTAYTLEGTGDSRALKKLADDADIKEPPYMLEIQLTMLDRDNYDKWQNISDNDAKENFLARHQRTFTRSVFIGNRWALASE